MSAAGRSSTGIAACAADRASPTSAQHQRAAAPTSATSSCCTSGVMRSCDTSAATTNSSPCACAFRWACRLSASSQSCCSNQAALPYCGGWGGVGRRGGVRAVVGAGGHRQKQAPVWRPRSTRCLHLLEVKHPQPLGDALSLGHGERRLLNEGCRAARERVMAGGRRRAGGASGGAPPASAPQRSGPRRCQTCVGVAEASAARPRSKSCCIGCLPDCTVRQRPCRQVYLGPSSIRHEAGRQKAIPRCTRGPSPS